MELQDGERPSEMSFINNSSSSQPNFIKFDIHNLHDEIYDYLNVKSIIKLKWQKKKLSCPNKTTKRHEIMKKKKMACVDYYVVHIFSK